MKGVRKKWVEGRRWKGRRKNGECLEERKGGGRKRWEGKRK